MPAHRHIAISPAVGGVRTEQTNLNKKKLSSTPGLFKTHLYQLMLMSYSIQPWLSVRNSKKALAFYKLAFGAIETYRLDTSDETVVAKLSINGAEFWLSDESPDFGNFSPESLNGSTTRMILIVTEPEVVFEKALAAGATQIFPVGEGHGWKLGRIVDPFGHHWEIGHPLDK